jgi:hypothetical protein
MEKGEKTETAMEAGQVRPGGYRFVTVSGLYDLIETTFLWGLVIGAIFLVAYLSYKQVRTMRMKRWRRRHGHSRHHHSRMDR